MQCRYESVCNDGPQALKPASQWEGLTIRKFLYSLTAKMGLKCKRLSMGEETYKSTTASADAT